jgi:hypothetical protein
MGFKFNALTGRLDLTNKKSIEFSVYQINEGEVVTIGSGREMLLKSALVNRGVLYNNGIIRGVKDDVSQVPFWKVIPQGKTVVIYENKVMFVKGVLRNYGILRNKGTVEGI